jgi:hypothetical protein
MFSFSQNLINRVCKIKLQKTPLKNYYIIKLLYNYEFVYGILFLKKMSILK